MKSPASFFYKVSPPVFQSKEMGGEVLTAVKKEGVYFQSYSVYWKIHKSSTPPPLPPPHLRRGKYLKTAGWYPATTEKAGSAKDPPLPF